MIERWAPRAVSSRFVTPGHGTGFWVSLWALAVAAEFGALDADHLRRRGARRGRRRRVPAGRRLVRGVRPRRLAAAAGQPQRPADDGDRLRPARLAAAEADPRRRRADGSARCSEDIWAPFFVALVLSFVTGGRLTSGGRPAHRRLGLRRRVRPRRLLDAVRRAAGQRAARVPERGDLRRGRRHAARDADRHLRSPCAAIVAGRWRAASAPRRRALLPSVAGAACMLDVRVAAGHRPRRGPAVAAR